MEKFAGYGFNKSHAAAYALVAYQTAYLKAHYPAEFMAATLSSDMDNTDKVVDFLDEARGARPRRAAAGRQPLDPRRFPRHPPAHRIRYGLGAIKGVGEPRLRCHRAARASRRAFANLRFLPARRAGLNKRVLEALITAGAMDTLGGNRASLMLQLPDVLKATDQIARNRDAGMVDMFGNATGAPDIHIDLPECDAWPLAQTCRANATRWATTSAGIRWIRIAKNCSGWSATTCHRWMRCGNRGRGSARGWRQEMQAVVAGQVIGMRKRGDSQAFVQLEDGRGRIECAFFGEQWQEFAPC